MAQSRSSSARGFANGLGCRTDIGFLPLIQASALFERPRANSTQVEPLSSRPARRLHRLAGRSAWWRYGQVRAGARILGGRPPDANPLGPLEFSPIPARRRLPVDPLRAARRRLVSRKIQAAERLYLGGTCSKGDDVAADFSNGVLKITVPKVAEEKVTAKKIRVNAL